MTKEEIISGNTIIAEFLGWNSEKEGIYQVSNLFPLKGDTGWMERHALTIGFDADWNMLMGVIEQIEEITPNVVKVKIVRKYACIDVYEHGGSWICDPIMSFQFVNNDSKIEGSYRAVVQFIQWYNKKNKNERTGDK